MQIEQIQEMFTSKSQQAMAQRVIEILAKYPNSTIIQLCDFLLSPKQVNNSRSALLRILDGLRALEIISYKMDRFNLNDCLIGKIGVIPASNESKLVYSLCQERQGYLVFECENCGAAIDSRSLQRLIVCKTCSHKNKINSKHKILLKTDNFLELLKTIQQKENSKVNL